MLIPDLTRMYLRVQCGYVPQPKGQTDAEFDAAYKAALQERYDNIAPHLPDTARYTMDIGGGMSGIGLKFREKYGRDLHHYVVDGLLDPAFVESHNSTFSSAPALAEYYFANGSPVTAVSPNTLNFGPCRYDIVTSFAAWGFHIEPDVYLPRVVSSLADAYTVIIDVRRGNHEWVEQFQDAFDASGTIIFSNQKLARYVWRRG